MYSSPPLVPNEGKNNVESEVWPAPGVSLSPKWVEIVGYMAAAVKTI